MSSHTITPRSSREGPNRPQPAFTSKYQQLPGISSPPPQGESGALVPVGALRLNRGSYDDRDERGSETGTGGGGGNGERMRTLEMRVNVAEKSNRALLEEVVRMQSELKGTIRRNEDIIREERQSRIQIENALRGANDLVGQLSMRLQRTEDKLTEEKSALSQLMTHSKSVEQTVLANQQEILSRRDVQHTKIQELRAELDETTRAKEQMEKLTYSLLDDMRALKSRVENQASDFTTVALDLRNKSRKLEDDTRQVRLDTMQKQGETQNHAEQSTSHLRSQVESRLSELRDVVVELRNRSDMEQQERRALEQHFNVKMSDLQAAITEQNRKREEGLHALDAAHREREHHVEQERLKLQSKVGEIAEEVSKKILQKEIKLRQESQDKFAALESLVMGEQTARQHFENDQRNDTERRWEALKQLTDEEMTAIREAFKMEKKRNQETFHRLHDAVNLVDKQVELMKRENDKVMGAEIQSRKAHQKETFSRLADVNDKLAVATSTLQQAIGGIQGKLEDELKKLKKELRARMDDQHQADTRTLADMDARVASQHRTIATLQDDLDRKLQQAQLDQEQALREKIQSVSLWQEVTQQTLREVQAHVRDLPHDITKLSDQQRNLQKELNMRVQAEADGRSRDVEVLRSEIDRMAKRKEEEKPGASRDDLESCQQAIRKLAESVQTVKTVLGMKIQAEHKSREGGLDNLQQEIDRVDRSLKDLEQRLKSDDKAAAGSGKPATPGADRPAPETNEPDWSS